MTALESVVESVERGLGYHFRDVGLFWEALTHSSYEAEHGDVASYERLEFLGDAVLELVTTHLIFCTLPDAPEGAMTKIRASVVDARTLALLARDLGLPDVIRLGKGEDQSGGRDRDSTLSDVIEALLGAVFLDGGWEGADRVVRALWAPIIESRDPSSGVTDPRSRLQEVLAREGKTVSFAYDRSGPDHAVQFKATAFVDGVQIATGTGSSKKAAAIDAARTAIAPDDSGLSQK